MGEKSTWPATVKIAALRSQFNLGIVRASAISEAQDSAPAVFSQVDLKIVCALVKSETLIPQQSMFIV